MVAVIPINGVVSCGIPFYDVVCWKNLSDRYIAIRQKSHMERDGEVVEAVFVKLRAAKRKRENVRTRALVGHMDKALHSLLL